MPFPWLAQFDNLTPLNLTIREATRLADNPLELRYRALFPRVPASSITIKTLTKVDFRPIGGRREWNAQGREIPENLGPTSEFTMVPINPTKHIDELMLQKLGEPGVQELVQRGVIKAVNDWPTELANAVERQLEAEAFEAWMTGIITVMDPKSGTTVTVSLGFTTAEYPTPGTDWDDPGEDAYVNFLAGLQAAESKFGQPVGGVRTHRTVVNAIVADAPDGALGAAPTQTSLQERIRAEGFPQATLVIDERTYHSWTDGGSATSPAYYVPDGMIGYQPADGMIGNTHDAPVVRAYDFLTGSNRSLAQGVTIFRSEQNSGKTLLIEAQRNAIAMPEAARVYAEDTGIAR
jgi:hypothetical protein